EAHEAIRPVDMHLHPDQAEKFLSKDQWRLYDLVWKRAIACQMKEAVLERVAAEIEAHKGASHVATFVATGQTVKFPGFMEVYMEGRDLEEEEKQDGEKFLPKLTEGEKILLEKLNDEQHFTKPPARYTEASLVKKLESEGIGRPSTYAPTISTIMVRGYIEKEGKALKPTDVAMVVTDMLVEHFSDIVDYKFTAEMEEKLDEIEEGKRKWVPVIREFYVPFNKNVKEKDLTLKKSDIVNAETDEICEKCGKSMIIKLGRFGKFLSCSNYPECKNARPLKNGEGGHLGSDAKPTHEQELESEEVKELKKKFKDKKCEKCGADMEVKNGKYGPFLGCSKYPECKNIVSITVFSGVKCPKCGGGQLVERRTRKGGRVFWGCNKFPKCKFATWDRPVENTKDGKGIVVENKNGEKFTVGQDGKREE
ncbi:MAG: DNA topoisomerase, partial [Candidatus Gracilibacteria bacterium]